MVHRTLMSYGRPEDPGAFDQYYRDTHVPLAMAMPGLVRSAVGPAAPVDPSQPAPYMIAELDFGSAEDMGQAFASPAGEAAAADLADFATGGATLAHYEVREISADLPTMP